MAETLPHDIRPRMGHGERETNFSGLPARKCDPKTKQKQKTRHGAQWAVIIHILIRLKYLLFSSYLISIINLFIFINFNYISYLFISHLSNNFNAHAVLPTVRRQEKSEITDIDKRVRKEAVKETNNVKRQRPSQERSLAKEKTLLEQANEMRFSLPTWALDLRRGSWPGHGLPSL